MKNKNKKVGSFVIVIERANWLSYILFLKIPQRIRF